MPAVLAAGIAVSAIVALVLWLRLQALRKSVEKIQQTCVRLTQGNPAARVLLPGSDAGARLADAVNALAEKVQQDQEAWGRYAQAQKRLLTTIAHDLRTPITSIAGYIGALQQGMATPEEQRRFLGIAQQKTADLTALVDDLFYLTRLESGDMSMKTSPVDLAEALRQSLLGFVPQIEADSMDVRVQIPEFRCIVNSDELALRRIFANLIGNSLRHGIGKTILGVELMPESSHYRAVIWDNGQGFAPGALERILAGGPDHEGGTLTRGAGLGIAIARDLVEKLGGNLSAESVPWQRTAFTVVLPKIADDCP